MLIRSWLPFWELFASLVSVDAADFATQIVQQANLE